MYKNQQLATFMANASLRNSGTFTIEGVVTNGYGNPTEIIGTVKINNVVTNTSWFLDGTSKIDFNYDLIVFISLEDYNELT